MADPSDGPPTARLVLRGNIPEGTLFLPTTINTATTNGDQAALKLGPDEWLLLTPEPGLQSLAATVEAALSTTPHALIDISHRHRTLLLGGTDAPAILNAGCPLDLSPETFPPGTATRTILGKSEIILWRKTPTQFHLEVPRSYTPYLRQYLTEAARTQTP